MTCRAWRIIKAKHESTALSGDGARQYGGRWNSEGVSVVYAAGSAALAVLEVLVHLERNELLRAFRLFEMDFDEALIEAVSPKQLPVGWRSERHVDALRQIGDEWIASQRSAVLRVPSVVVDDEWNYLLNPLHPRFANIKIGKPRPFRFDPRLGS